MEKWITKKEIHKGKIFSLWGGKVSLDNGDTAVREYVRHPGGVAIVPVVDHNVILIRQFRITIERELIELPAGLLEAGEEPMDCAARELEEEIGYRAQELIPLASYYSSVGFADERMHIFLALNPQKTRLNLQADERISQVLVPVEQVAQTLDAQEYEDAKTIIGLREFLAYRERTKSGSS
jgi:ADP-ribose pyrophosphatase